MPMDLKWCGFRKWFMYHYYDMRCCCMVWRFNTAAVTNYSCLSPPLLFSTPLALQGRPHWQPHEVCIPQCFKRMKENRLSPRDTVVRGKKYRQVWREQVERRDSRGSAREWPGNWRGVKILYTTNHNHGPPQTKEISASDGMISERVRQLSPTWAVTGSSPTGSHRSWLSDSL